MAILKNDFGIYIISGKEKELFAGDYNKTFTIQSIVKPIILLLALMDNGMEVVREKVGLEATGNPGIDIDFDKALENQERPNHFLPEYDSGDHLHPSKKGYERMAAEVPVEILK